MGFLRSCWEKGNNCQVLWFMLGRVVAGFLISKGLELAERAFLRVHLLGLGILGNPKLVLGRPVYRLPPDGSYICSECLTLAQNRRLEPERRSLFFRFQ